MSIDILALNPPQDINAFQKSYQNYLKVKCHISMFFPEHNKKMPKTNLQVAISALL